MVRRFVASVAAATIAFTAMVQPAGAQSRGGGLAVVRDTEVEQTIRTFASPLFRSAGLDPGAVRIILVNDRSLNAFVAGGQNLFVHTGLLVRAAHAGQVIGVIAHETGHIAGGHLARLPDAMRNAMVTSLLSMLLGAAAAAAGGRGDVGAAVITGGASMAQRNFFAFTRSQETAADQAGISFLESTGQSARGFLEFMEILANQEFMAISRQDPYMRTHPLSAERVDFLRNQVARSPYSSTPVSPEFAALHRRMKAKLGAFLDAPTSTLAKYAESDTSFDARYARAIALYRIPDLPNALKAVDRLIADYPTDPYLHELRGQMLFENGRAAESLPAYERAIALMPQAALLHIDMAQAQIELNDPRLLPAAVAQLNEAARGVEARNSKLWRLLAIAYGRDGQFGLASMALAEQALLEGRRRDARDQARRALRMLPEGSPGWLRAQDTEGQALREEEEERR